MPATISANGSIKFCGGWFDGEIWVNQIQDGTSFGVYEISAKNNNVPTKRRMRAKTSLQALCLSVRATASDSNSMPASFNLVVAALAATSLLLVLVIAILIVSALRF